ncbi:hypothetical protein M2282_003552 [Variovorax boronicumulans]|uniref:hypothetical protein n=1 Tax=Variovorax boronicumulans TaxID=436515 RepID=UPI0024745073|nr:hypothetical protein [Variovorax boronicumulans]MDH6168399.1 hypothetical protein [Variovorax boronicumulans]
MTSNAGFSIWWVLVPLLVWLGCTLGVTLVRERHKHTERVARVQADANILAHGTPAMAEVIASSDTGQRRSGEGGSWGVLKLHLRVRTSATAEAFDVQQTASIPVAELPDHAAGKTIAVRFDAASRTVAIERSAKGPAP